MPFDHFRGGWLEIITGAMFSGKSEELIRRATRALIAKQEVQVFKPAIDKRYQELAVASHAGRTLKAVSVKDVLRMHNLIQPATQVIAIDEAQFFSHDLVELTKNLADQGKRSIVAGLDLDFRAEPFGCMPELLARAEYVHKLTAICVVCGNSATRTQRIINGKPAHYDDPLVLVSGSESYEPRCRSCHEIPKR